MALFYECTSITVGNGQRASFWHSPWIGGRKPKDIPPSIFAISNHKNDTIHRALDLNKWIANINTNSGLTIQHILEYYELWVGLREVFLDEGVDDEIVWKLSPSGEYTTSSAYKAQLDDSTEAGSVEQLGAAKAQILCLAYHSRPCLDGGQASTERMAKLRPMPVMQEGARAGGTHHLPVSIHGTYLDGDQDLDGFDRCGHH